MMPVAVNSPINTFSRAIDALYRMAESTSLDAFPEALLDLIRPHLPFDGAVIGHADPLSHGDFSISVAHVHRREQQLLDDYAAVSASDPVTQAFLRGLEAPLCVDAEAFYGAPEHAAMLALTRRHRLRQIILCGHPPSQTEGGRWITLYRADGVPFDAASADWLGAYWAHSGRALAMNRARALAQMPHATGADAVALVDARGRVEAAGAAFAALILGEFGVTLRHRLPDALAKAMAADQPYEGRTLSARFTRLGRHRVCELREAGALAQLSPRERLVAARFALGPSSREIAQEMGVSHYTVQSQLASVYRKLGVSDKTALARLLAPRGN